MGNTLPSSLKCYFGFSFEIKTLVLRDFGKELHYIYNCPDTINTSHHRCLQKPQKEADVREGLRCVSSLMFCPCFQPRANQSKANMRP